MNSPYFIFVGGKGGCGTTTVCCAVAKAIRSDHNNVAAVDADLSGRRSMAVLLDAVRSLDLSRLQEPVAVARVESMTVAELAPSYDAAFTIDNAAVESLAGSLQGFRTVLVDAPQPFAAAVRPFVARSARVFVVVEPSVLGVTGARAVISDLKRFGISPERMALVTNVQKRNGHLSRAEVESALGLTVVAEFPEHSERGYEKALAILAKYILAVSVPSEIISLAPSATIPTTERRGVSQRVPATAQNGKSNGEYDATSARRDDLKLRIHKALSKQVDFVAASRADTDSAKLAELRSKIESVTQSLLSEQAADESAESLASLRREVMDEALGLGPLEDLMNDPSVTEVMVNGPEHIFIERNGKIEPTAKRFVDETQLRVVIERIIAPLGRRIDESSPMVDARLADGSRVNAAISPVVLDGSTVTIRRFGTRRLDAGDILRLGSANAPMMEFLRAAVEGRLNVVVSGGTGSGKTTFLNVLSSFLPDSERIITIEDAAELLLQQSHVVRMESRPPNIEGRGEIRIRDLVRNALRMRPDRIVVGECRGAEAIDMLQAMNTGHDGSLTTVHANSPHDALSRIETMVLMAGLELPVRAIREQIASAVNVVIQTARLRDGRRVVSSISEVVGMEGDVVTMQEVVRFAQRGIDDQKKVLGDFEFTGVQPQCLRRFAEFGVHYDVRNLATLPAASGAW